MSWECPECGETVSDDSLIHCPNCGYVAREEELGNTKPAEKPKTRSAYGVHDFEKTKRRKRVSKKADTKTLWEYVCSWFDWKTWKSAYFRWFFCFYCIVFILRDFTVDGLVVFFLLLFLIVLRFSESKKRGWPFVPGLKKGEKIREYGFRLALSSTLYDWWIVKGVEEKANQELPGERTQTNIIFGGMLLTMILLHCYMSIVIVSDYINPEWTAKILTLINTPFGPLLEHWFGPRHTINALISHGYSDRVAIVAHSYVATVVGALLYVLSCLFYLFRHLNSFDELLSGYIRYCKLQLRTPAIRTLARHPRLRSVCMILFQIGVVIGLFCLFAYPLKFAGERMSGSGRFVWLASHVYRDNLGLFTPIFLMLGVWGGVNTIVMVYSPLHTYFKSLKLYLANIIIKNM